MAITFKQFVASRKLVDDLGPWMTGFPDDDQPEPGYVYLDSFYINIDNMGEENETKRVIIGSSEDVFDDLDLAEHFLWNQFARFEAQYVPLPEDINCGACTVAIGAHTKLPGRCREAS